jgi:hypothetical protein
MLPARLDVTLAFKHVALSKLTGTEKRVAMAVIDSFNRKTGQCDPGFDRIAHLLQLNRRTVIRAINAIERTRLLSRARHGGKFHRNQYQPNWPLFRELEKHWVAHKETKHWQSSTENLSPSLVSQRGTGAGDGDVTQTFPCNNSLSTSGAGSVIVRQPRVEVAASAVGYPRKYSGGIGSVSSTISGARRTALRDAERRWNQELHRFLKDDVAVYGQVIAAIDGALLEAATEAEMAKVGAGLITIVAELQRRGVKL